MQACHFAAARKHLTLQHVIHDASGTYFVECAYLLSLSTVSRRPVLVVVVRYAIDIRIAQGSRCSRAGFQHGAVRYEEACCCRGETVKHRRCPLPPPAPPSILNRARSVVLV